MKPKVSIITISYQAEKYLKRTLESVLSQSYSPIEYLIVDGGSSDGTLAIVREFEPAFKAKGFDFRWISEPDKGIYDAMNKAIKLATGDYLWFMNAGDRIAASDTLETVFDAIFPHFNDQNSPLEPDFIYGETKIVNEAGEVMGDRRLKAPEMLHWRSFKMGMLVCHQSMIVKRSLVPLYDLTYRYSGDFDWTIRCLLKAKSIHNTNVVLAHFLDGGVSKKKMKASLKERFEIMSKYYGFLPTLLRHAWFICRAFWFKLRHGWI